MVLRFKSPYPNFYNCLFARHKRKDFTHVQHQFFWFKSPYPKGYNCCAEPGRISLPAFSSFGLKSIILKGTTAVPDTRRIPPRIQRSSSGLSPRILKVQLLYQTQGRISLPAFNAVLLV
ncbi:hypothetical protein AVEN_192733-1 [Araneus ventricosus]|uniref:Uncharacterized protein n=1 Tax=Araneus ventricosus TaxID=182803 RepID=A0A4Y2SVS3_ARAVE|nr:hypothetical protein AVEN_192733-1 [Araneus ventricosus]